MELKKFLGAALAAMLIAGGLSAAALAQNSMMSNSMQDPMVGGAAMSPAKNIVQNAANSKDHTTLVALVKQAGLVQTFESPGPFTVFAPTNAAFAKLPKATVDKVTSDNALLTKVLTYHVIAGRLDSKAIEAKIAAGGGSAKLTTVEGESLTAKMDGAKLVLIDAHGDTSTVTIADVYQSNGIIHVVDTVLVP